MLVKLRMIPHNKPLNLDFEIAPDVLQGELSKKSQLIASEKFVHPAECSVELRQKHRLDDVELQGDVSCIFEAACSRCNQNFDYTYQDQLFVVCARKTEAPRRTKKAYDKRKLQYEDDVEQSEEGLVFFSNEEIDLTEIIREHILINLPMRYQCAEDCKGLCTFCGEKLPPSDVHECTKKK